jgi:hypothetical protein
MSSDDSNDVPFYCAAEKGRGACSALNAYRSHEGKEYCVLHFAGTKGPEFSLAVQDKIKKADFDFSGVCFPPDPAEFSNLKFTAEARFPWATFNGDVDFGDAVFDSRADFSNATFGGLAKFSSALFSARADFYSTTFKGEVLFTFATFSGEANFQKAFFDSLLSLDFINAKDYLLFGTKRNNKHEGQRSQGFSLSSALSMEGAHIAHPEYVSFHTLELRPHWFINIDTREFIFTQVDWRDFSGRRLGPNIDKEISILKDADSPHRLLSITYRQLALNGEENHRYKQASMFRFCSMDVRRREHSLIRSVFTIDWWYWAASGYGESVGQAFGVLLLLWLLLSVPYFFVGFTKPIPRPSSDSGNTAQASNEAAAQRLSPRATAFLYSAEIMTLQKPDSKPATPLARIFVTLETIFGPTQIALLALAIRRKFMR